MNTTRILTLLACSLLALPTSLFAWEPGAGESEKAIRSGDFAGCFTSATKWLTEKAPTGDAAKIAEAAQGALFKDAALASTLAQRQLIAKCGADKLGAFAKADPGNQAFLAWLMKSPEVLGLFLEGGEPRDQDYVGALGVLRKIVAADPEARQGLHLRLALGTALALARPTKAFHCDETIDPVKRYQHYKAAHQSGELAPMFDELRVWESTKVVNCDGTDADITWARAMLKTLRPEPAAKETDPGNPNAKEDQ